MSILLGTKMLGSATASVSISMPDPLTAAEKQQHYENLGFTAYANLATANGALPIGRLFFNIATSLLEITTA